MRRLLRALARFAPATPEPAAAAEPERFGSACLRWAGRGARHVLPIDQAPQSFDAYLEEVRRHEAALGKPSSIEAMTPDDLAELYLSVSELLAGTAPAPVVATVADLDAALAEPVPDPAPQKLEAMHPELPAPEAAKRFLAWVRDTGRGRRYLQSEVTDLYAEHCAAIGHMPTPENMLRRELRKLGVTVRSEVVGTRPRIKGQSKETRIREKEWDLSAKSPVLLEKPTVSGKLNRKTDEFPYDLLSRKAA